MGKSQSLLSLEGAILEVNHLVSANPSRSGGESANLLVTSAIGRAAVVLLTSHFERYFYSINEEAVAYFNQVCGDPNLLPRELKLWHSKVGLDPIEETKWDRREIHLTNFSQSDYWLWGPEPCTGSLEHDRILTWMKSPKPKEIVRFYRMWGIEDIFSSVTRKRATRTEFWLKIQSLADKRNSIAHGEAQETASITDVRSYSAKAIEFIRRVDRFFGRHMMRITSSSQAAW